MHHHFHIANNDAGFKCGHCGRVDLGCHPFRPLMRAIAEKTASKFKFVSNLRTALASYEAEAKCVQASNSANCCPDVYKLVLVQYRRAKQCLATGFSNWFATLFYRHVFRPTCSE